MQSYGGMPSIMAESADKIRRTRIARGMSQTELARRAGISRQALGAIESGVYHPGVAVALAIARELGETVESLFGEDRFERVEAHVAAPDGLNSARPGEGVALGRVAGRIVAVPYAGASRMLVSAGGKIEKLAGTRAFVESFRSASEIEATLLVAGCDPAVSLMADWIARHHAPVTIVSFARASRQALGALVVGQVHAAGAHLRDRKTGEYNLDAVRKAMGRRKAVLIGFARWELGLAIAPKNPLGIRGFDDLARSGIRIVNRDRGSGARAALDDALEDIGIKPAAIAGYEVEVPGHLEVAESVAAGHADTGVTIRVAANAYGLGFLPLREERYDLVIPESEMKSAPVRAMLESLNSARFAREVATLCGYDTGGMGVVAAHIG
jgi:molybdate-binding protein/DNA-binding XRE family transcriptional regulator